MNISLQDKTILVTGGTGGLGQALVQTLSEEGAQVLFSYCSHEDRVADIEALGAKGYFLDLSNRNSVNKFSKQIVNEYSVIDGIIHNAAISRDHSILKLTEEEFDESLEVNLSSVFFLTRHLVPLLEKAKHPKIINMVSRVGVRGNFGQIAYTASKAGLISLTKSMALELGDKGIMVNSLTPGYVMTDMTGVLPEFVHDKAKSESYLNTISDAGEVARFVSYLMSDYVTKLSGQLFHYDTRRN